MTVKFIPLDRDTPYIFPPSVQDYLPEGHLARFVVEIVEQLNLNNLSSAYSGKGSKPYHPALLVALLFYGYSTGVFSSRKLEKASYDSIAFRYICANTNPDHDTIATFRKRFLKELEALFVDILLVAEAMGLVKLGTVSLDGTKIKANASKHRALSWGYANKLEAQLKDEVKQLLLLAEEADQNTLPEDMDIPDELKHRKDRLVVIERAKKKIQARAQERFEREHAAYEEKVDRRKAYEDKTDKKARGRKPIAPTQEPLDKDQVNLTDEESRIMPASSGGFEQGYNAQAGVDVDTHLIVEQHITQQANDKQEIEPALERLAALPEELGDVDSLLADTGYFSETNIDRCADARIEPFIPEKRQAHNLPLIERFKGDPKSPQTPIQYRP